jgi:hypothetical protein
MNLEPFEITLGTHNSKEVIWIRFQKDYKLIALLKEKPDCADLQ